MAESSNGSNPTDPSGFLTPPQQLVKIVNTTRENLNGKISKVLSFDTHRNRYTIAIPPENFSAVSPQSQQPTILSLKTDNLVAVSMKEKVLFRATEMRQQAQTMLNDPNVRRQFQTAYNTLQNRLPPAVKPEYMATGLLALFFLSIYFFGLSKSLLATSLLSFPVLICAPDLMSNKDTRFVVKNFPSRLRFAIVEMTGYTKISERMALVAFILFFFMSMKVVFTPSAVAVAPVMKPSTISAKYSTPNTALESKLEDYYKIGFDDATAGHPFGLNIPAEEFVSNTDHKSSNFDDELDWAYNPDAMPAQVPKNSISSKFGFSTMMALFTLFKTGKDLAIDNDGRPNLQLLIANVKMLDPMRLGLIGFSIYRLVHVFLF